VVLSLLVLGLVLFSFEVLSVDLVTLLLLLGLVVSGVLTPPEAFAGFGSDIVVILVSIYVASGALQQSGVLAALGERLAKLAAGRGRRLALLLAGSTAAVSAVMNNTTATAVFLPPAMEAARRSKVSPSKLLMPLAYASILGGTCTLVGTSTNVAVSGAMAALGLEPLGVFELTPAGLVLVATGFVYLFTIAQRQLPDHPETSLAEAYEIRSYLTEVVVLPGSAMAGQRVFDSELSRLGLRVLAIERAGKAALPDPETRLEAGDLLIVQASIEQVQKIAEVQGLAVRADLELGDRELQPARVRLAEAIVTPASTLIGRTLKEIDFRRRFAVVALALHRHGQTSQLKLGRVRLAPGDLLLLQGPHERVAALARNPDLWVLEDPEPRTYPRRRRGIWAAGFLLAALIASGAGLVPLAIAVLAAAVAIVTVGAITVEEAYRFIDWRLIVLIGGMTAFGTAMSKSGTAELLAHWVVAGLGPLGPLAVLGGFAVLTVLLTQPMSNAAAALVVVPVAIEAAVALGVSPRTFAVGICLAASVSLATPLEPSCLLVYGPGKYRFADFVRIGTPMTLVLVAVLLAVLPWLWPL
jgi:di/tricarboxylate transporter